MMSAGIRSGVNWMRWKLQVQRLGERAHEQRLAQARHAFEQHVAAGDHGDDRMLDDLLLADDDLARSPP